MLSLTSDGMYFQREEKIMLTTTEKNGKFMEHNFCDVMNHMGYKFGKSRIDNFLNLCGKMLFAK